MVWVDLAKTSFEEKMLWASVLRRTIYDYVLYKGVRKHRHRWQEAYKFIFGVDEEASLSFEEICCLFGWEPDYVRRMVKKLERKDIRKLETMKFRETFEGQTVKTYRPRAHWTCGTSILGFAPYNYSKDLRKHLCVRPIRPKRPKSFIPKVRWGTVS